MTGDGHNVYPRPVQPSKNAQEVIAACKTLLEFFGIRDTYETTQQLLVMLKALQVYDQRDKVYGSVWKQYGSLSPLLSAARKVDRLMSIWWHKSEAIFGKAAKDVTHKDALDDAVDAINYLVFFLRLKDSSLTGKEPLRPLIEELAERADKDRARAESIHAIDNFGDMDD